jgi:adenylate cyclase
MAGLDPRAAATVRVMVTIALISAVVGAVYGVISFPDRPLFAALRGGVTGAAIALLIGSFELAVVAGRLLRHLPVGLLVVLRTVAYTVLIIVGYELGRLLALAPNRQIFEFDAFFWRTVWISLAVSFVGNSALEISRHLGGEVLWGLLIGRYLLPRVEQRLVLFIDLKDSTRHAERLGDLKFHSLLNHFFQDVSHAVLSSSGTIYKYNGDAAIVLWRVERGLRKGNAVRCVMELRRQLAKRGDLYRREFGLTAEFRAGLHMGPVVVGEIGDQRHEIAFSGDAMNTTARIEQAARELGVDFLLSAAVAERLPPVEGLQLRSVGSVSVAGKAEKLSLSTVEKV